MSNLFNDSTGTLEDGEILSIILNEFNTSQERNWMLIGERYYKVDNDINKRVLERYMEDNNGKIYTEVDKSKTNNKLAHGFAKNLVDEKVAYLLAKDYSIVCENEKYIESIKKALGRRFGYVLIGLGYEASNKGIGWLHPYIKENTGKLEYMVVPAEECCPIWKDNTHTELEAMIRYYSQDIYQGSNKETIIKVEFWTEEKVDFYILEGNKLILDVEREMINGGPILHYTKNNTWKSWGKVPFIAFKNNRIEYPDIRFIKSLIDSYDLSRSDIANFIEEVKNLIYVLKGYGGESLGKFMKDLAYFNAILIDDPVSGGVDTLNPTIDITASKEHFEQLKRDINEFGQGVTKDLDKFGASPSGVALKFLYTGLDLKCNNMEKEFKNAFEELLYFINIYLSESSQGIFNDIDIDIIFNRDIQINETEAIDNCIKSTAVISKKTVIGNHPWVKDIELEQKQLKEQQEEEEAYFDNIPIPKNKKNKEDIGNEE